jgi:hypothetical protein
MAPLQKLIHRSQEIQLLLCPAPEETRKSRVVKGKEIAELSWCYYLGETIKI